MIRVSNLSRHFGELRAVDRISFDVPQGQIVGLLGHNGAGKTTIMRMITGYLEPTSGEVLIDGSNILEERIKIQKRIGYLPENSPTYPEMTVLEYLQYVIQLRGISPEAQMAALERAVIKAGLKQKVRSKISTLSKGYKQRVGVAQAIIHNPDILILDEPTSGLDPSQILEMRHLIQELSKETTVIISTHILQEVEAICDRAIIILQGRVAKDALLSNLRQSNTLLVALDKDPLVARPVLERGTGVDEVYHVGQEGVIYLYRIKVRDDEQYTASDIAELVIENGWKLYSLEKERRDLETVFREVSEGITPQGHARQAKGVFY